MWRLAMVSALPLLLTSCTDTGVKSRPSDERQLEIPDVRGVFLTLDAASKALGEITAVQVRPYCSFDFGRQRDDACRSVILPERDAKTLLFKFRPHLDAGLVAFVGTTRWLGDEVHEGVEFAVGQGADKFDILRLARSDAINYGMETNDLIARLATYDEEFGIDIFHAETDTIEFQLVSEPSDWTAFARELYDFCPDIVDQGVGTVEALEEGLRTTHAVFLWWD